VRCVNNWQCDYGASIAKRLPFAKNDAAATPLLSAAAASRFDQPRRSTQPLSVLRLQFTLRRQPVLLTSKS